MFFRERGSDFSLTLSQPLLRLGLGGDLAPGSPGFLQVYPGYPSKSSWLLTQYRVLPSCPSFPLVRLLQHRHHFAPLCPSFMAWVHCALSLSNRQTLWTTSRVPNLRSDSATHHQVEKTSQLTVNLKPPILPPPEPPPTGFYLNPFSIDELLATGCVSRRPPPKPPWLYWDWFKLAWMVFVDMPQQRFVFLEKDMVDPLDVVDANICNHLLFEFSSNRVFNFDIETTYSQNELAAVANLIHNWIEKKTVDSLLFIVIDRGRKTLQPWKFVRICWLNNTHLAHSHSFTTNAYFLLGFNFSCYLSTCWRSFKDFSLSQFVILVEFAFTVKKKKDILPFMKRDLLNYATETLKRTKQFMKTP